MTDGNEDWKVFVEKEGMWRVDDFACKEKADQRVGVEADVVRRVVDRSVLQGSEDARELSS